MCHFDLSKTIKLHFEHFLTDFKLYKVAILIIAVVPRYVASISYLI